MLLYALEWMLLVLRVHLIIHVVQEAGYAPFFLVFAKQPGVVSHRRLYGVRVAAEAFRGGPFMEEVECFLVCGHYIALLTGVQAGGCSKLRADERCRRTRRRREMPHALPYPADAHRIALFHGC